jgi:hypothetical protein
VVLGYPVLVENYRHLKASESQKIENAGLTNDACTGLNVFALALGAAALFLKRVRTPLFIASIASLATAAIGKIINEDEKKLAPLAPATVSEFRHRLNIMDNNLGDDGPKAS